jgi:hypothetical protein
MDTEKERAITDTLKMNLEFASEQIDLRNQVVNTWFDL